MPAAVAAATSVPLSTEEKLAAVADDDKLFEPQVAALFGWSPRTVKKYKLNGRLPEPDGTEPPPGRPWTDKSGSGPPSSYWLGSTIKAFAETLQPPGRPRKDGEPRQRHKDTYAKPGPKPGAPASAATVRKALDDLGGQATDEELLRHLRGKGSQLDREQLRAILVSMGRRRTVKP